MKNTVRVSTSSIRCEHHGEPLIRLFPGRWDADQQAAERRLPVAPIERVVLRTRDRYIGRLNFLVRMSVQLTAARRAERRWRVPAVVTVAGGPLILTPTVVRLSLLLGTFTTAAMTSSWMWIALLPVS